MAVHETSDGNTFLSSECVIKKVTVYSDRAEVCRIAEANVKKGVNEIVVKQLPKCIDPDSIRVEGKGPATLVEVSFQRKFLPKNEAEISQKEKEYTAELESLEKQKAELTAKLNVVDKQRDILHTFAQSISSGQNSGKNASPILDSQLFKGISDFIQLVGSQGNDLESRYLEIQGQITAVVDKIEAVKKNLQSLKSTGKGPQDSRECTIVLECEEKAKIILIISYVVTCASWIPSYDIRMFTTEEIMKIFYFGQIRQSTGEDWNDAKLFLSTAAPNIGGVVPELSVQTVSIKYRTPLRMEKGRGLLRSQKSRKPLASPECLMESGLIDGYYMDLPEEHEECIPKMEVATSEVSKTTTCTTYEIARVSTIPCDNIDHKVSVGIFDVKPVLEYITVPTAAQHAFLQARVTNTSQFSLLPGTTNIFLDNSFVAKATMKAVSPGEEFECSLGVDPGVRVTYKPLYKFRESSGIFAKMLCQNFQQVTELKNTHDYPIKIELRDRLPRSGDDKIKINLLEPAIDMKHPQRNNKNVYLTKDNHVIWKLELDKQEKREITLKYTVEHPFNEEITFD